MLPDVLAVERATRRWVSQFVLDLNLCPFAAAAMHRLRVEVILETSAQEVLHLLLDELQRLDRSAEIETTLLVLPNAFAEFLDYNDFLDECDALVRTRGYEGVYQIASFHPGYQFANTRPDDAENFATRSPYPMLHVLRESSVSRAIDRHPEVESIAENNITRLRALGTQHLQRLLASCREG